MTTSINQSSELLTHITGIEQVAYEGWSVVNDETSSLLSISPFNFLDHEKLLVIEAPDALVESGTLSVVVSADGKSQIVSSSLKDFSDGYMTDIYDLSESHMFLEQTLANALRTLDAIELLLELINSRCNSNSMFFYINAFKNFRQPINQLVKEAINLHCTDNADINPEIEQITELLIDEVRNYWKVIAYEFKRSSRLIAQVKKIAISGGQ